VLGRRADVAADDIGQLADLYFRLLDVVRDRDRERAVNAFAIERDRFTWRQREPRGRNFLTRLMPCKRRFFHELVRVPG
jgi:hypothetical protein